METRKILETYKRYLQTIEDLNSDLFTNYKTISKFLYDKCNDNELSTLMNLHCIGQVVQEIKRRDIRIKDVCKEGWSSSATQEGYRLLRNMKNHQYDFDNTTFIINFKRFMELIKNQSPYVELYLWYCYSNEIGTRLFRVSMSEIEEAAANAIKAEEENYADSEANEQEP